VIEPACSSGFLSLWSVLLIFRNSAQKNGREDTVADAINWHVGVPLLPVNELAMNLAS